MGERPSTLSTLSYAPASVCKHVTQKTAGHLEQRTALVTPPRPEALSSPPRAAAAVAAAPAPSSSRSPPKASPWSLAGASGSVTMPQRWQKVWAVS